MTFHLAFKVKDIVYSSNESNQTHINLNASTRQESGMVIGCKEILNWATTDGYCVGLSNL